MPLISIPNANVGFDTEWAMEQLDCFNSNLLWTGSDHLVWQMFRNPQRRWASSLVDTVDGLMRTRVPRNHRHNLGCFVDNAWERIFGKLNQHPDLDNLNNPVGIFEAVQPLLGDFLAVNDVKHYSFATKFLHWASHGRLPIVDSLARKSLFRLQKEFRQDGDWISESRIRKNARTDLREDYKNWLFLYSNMVEGLQEYKEQLLERDRTVQEDAIGGQNECFIIAHNSLVRVLDKVFWIDGA